MRAICLYLHIHQPIRYREYSIFDVGNDSNYYNDNYDSRQSNERIFNKVADKSYRPMLARLEKCINTYPGFKFSLSITGTFLEQAEMWAPDVIKTLQRLVKSGRVEIVAETYYHSLAFFYDREEFEAKLLIQVHDELDFSVPVSEIELLSAMVKDVMENAASLSVPLIVDVSWGDTWAEAH